MAGADTLGRSALTALMLANPASVFRLINQAHLGILSFDVPPAWLLVGLLVLWSAVLFVICAALLRSRRL